MKIGNIEGTPQEIQDLIVNHGLQLTDYLEVPEEPIARVWVLAPAILAAVALILIQLLSAYPKAVLPLFLLGTASLVWLAISLQIKFKNGWATAVAAVGGLIVLLVAAGYLAPKETIDAIKELKKE
jgi:hypothetical protein